MDMDTDMGMYASKAKGRARVDVDTWYGSCRAHSRLFPHGTGQGAGAVQGRTTPYSYE